VDIETAEPFSSLKWETESP